MTVNVAEPGARPCSRPWSASRSSTGPEAPAIGPRGIGNHFQPSTLVKEEESTIAEYEYDALGRRTKKTVDSAVTRFYHDGVHEIAEYDGDGALLRKFVYREGIDSIAMMEAPDQADVDGDEDFEELVRLFYHVDPRTNVAFLTDAAEDVVESYEYDPYGSVTIRDEAGDPAGTSAIGNPFTFQRRRLDEETGLYYFRARHFDPGTGQWMQRDPLGFAPGANWREFCGSSPGTNVDPLGLSPDKMPFEDIGGGPCPASWLRPSVGGGEITCGGDDPRLRLPHFGTPYPIIGYVPEPEWFPPPPVIGDPPRTRSTGFEIDLDVTASVTIAIFMGGGDGPDGPVGPPRENPLNNLPPEAVLHLPPPIEYIDDNPLHGYAAPY